MIMYIEGLIKSFVTENWLQLELWKITPRHINVYYFCHDS
jgi:hypothetical protein